MVALVILPMIEVVAASSIFGQQFYGNQLLYVTVNVYCWLLSITLVSGNIQT